MKTLIAPFDIAYKKRVYSPNRVLYPLKREDWNPDGERNIENRGKSRYVRISWDEALEIVVNEIKRVRGKYGPEAILAQADGHGEGKVVHTCHGSAVKFLEMLGGGYTLQIRNPDSWEGWYWCQTCLEYAQQSDVSQHEFNTGYCRNPTWFSGVVTLKQQPGV
jgi:trimethylamine-N-oxide reductase (cytochrome c)